MTSACWGGASTELGGNPKGLATISIYLDFEASTDLGSTEARIRKAIVEWSFRLASGSLFAAMTCCIFE